MTSDDSSLPRLQRTEPRVAPPDPMEKIYGPKFAFEMPKQLRELAEKNVEQARVAYAQFMDAMTQALSVWSTVPSNAMTAGFRDVQELAIRFAKEKAEAGFTLASDLANAKDI